jgi:hypothetical protein
MYPNGGRRRSSGVPREQRASGGLTARRDQCESPGCLMFRTVVEMVPGSAHLSDLTPMVVLKGGETMVGTDESQVSEVEWGQSRDR